MVSQGKQSLTLAGALCLVAALSACTKNTERTLREAQASGDRYVDQHKYNEAIVEYRRALQADGRAGGVRLKLGRAYLAVGDARSAFGEVVRAADLLPNNPDAQVQAGQILLLAGQFDEAKQRALQALGQNPKNVDAQILLGNALTGLKDLDGAIVQVEEAIAADPQRTLSYTNLGALQYAKGNRAEAEAAFKRALAVNPKAAAPRLALANYYWAVGQSVQAEQELKAAVQLEPESPAANRALATFYITAHKAAEAEQYLKGFAEGAPDTGPKITLADFYLSTGRPGDARAVLEPLLATTDAFVPAKLRIAAIEYAAGHRDQARTALAEILKRDAHNENARLMKARFLLGERKPAEALALAKSVVADNANSVAGHFTQALALEATGVPDEATNELQTVLRLNPTTVPALAELAKLALARGDAKSAAQYAQQALKARPDLAPVRLLFAQALLRQGSSDAAERELIALKSAPASLDVDTTLGALYAARNDRTRARQTLNRALERNPSSIDALAALTNLDIAEKRTAEARARIEKRLASAPHDVGVLLLAGSAFAAFGDAQKAESTWRQVLQIDPANLDSYGRLASLYLSQRRLDEAKQEFTELARRQPKPVAATTMIGIILSLQNNLAEARKQYERVLALDPSAAIAANNLAWVYTETGGNLDIALQLAQTAKQQIPNRHEVDDTLGWVYYKKGLSSRAIDSFQRSVSAVPDNPIYLYHLGAAYAQHGDKTQARRSLEQALKLKPDFDGSTDARKVLKSLEG